jgi:hypothetical protein
MAFFGSLTEEYDRLYRETGQEADEREGRMVRKKAGVQALRDAVVTLKEVKRLQKEQQASLIIIDRICKKAGAEVRRQQQAEIDQALDEAAAAMVTTSSVDPKLLLDVRQKAEDLRRVRLDSQKIPQALRDLKQAIQSLQAARPQP